MLVKRKKKKCRENIYIMGNKQWCVVLMYTAVKRVDPRGQYYGNHSLIVLDVGS